MPEKCRFEESYERYEYEYHVAEGVFLCLHLISKNFIFVPSMIHQSFIDEIYSLRRT